MDARLHHLQAKYLLAQMALQDPQRFFATFGPSGDQDYLSKLWKAIGQEMPEEERVAAGEVSVFQSKTDGLPDHIVICLPTPERRNEAYFLGLIRQDDDVRVFALERSESPMTGVGTMVAEFMPQGRANWGPGCKSDAEAFVQHTAAIARDANASPVSFIPMKFA